MKIFNRNINILVLEKKDLRRVKLEHEKLSLADFNLPKTDLTNFDLIIFTPIYSNEIQVLYLNGEITNV